MVITLPFPPAELFPNRANGKHWSSTRAKKDAYRDEAFYIAKAAKFSDVWLAAAQRETDGIALKVTFVQPDNRHRDMDNMLAAAKHALDGFAKAIGVDDKRFRPITIDWTREKGAGSLIVEI